MFTQTHVGFSRPDFSYASYPFHPGYATVERTIDVRAEVVDLQAGGLVVARTRHASHAVPSRWEKVADTTTIQRVPFASMAQVALTSARLSNIRLGQIVVVFDQGLVAEAWQVIGIDLIPVGWRSRPNVDRYSDQFHTNRSHRPDQTPDWRYGFASSR